MFLGAAKFDVEKFSKIIMESTGAEVDEDDVIQCLPGGEVLTLLEEGQDWSPQSTEVCLTNHFITFHKIKMYSPQLSPYAYVA